MTPPARVQVAIDILDRIFEGLPAEKALSAWSRRARYAGSKDRAAVRDLVFQALRCRDSYAARGGGLTGRQVMMGHILTEGGELEDVFTGASYAPAPLSASEQAAVTPECCDAPTDLPSWILEKFTISLGEEQGAEAAEVLRHRAPVSVRLNARKTTRDDLIASLAADGIDAWPVPSVESALVLVEGARRLSQSKAYHAGEVEVQDAHSQAAMACLEVAQGARFLDYCAGGGGKTLAVAARSDVRFFAHDADPGRMTDLPMRAKRAGIRVDLVSGDAVGRHAPYHVVLCDVPCSGSGTWRRTPEAKWTLTPPRLYALCRTQSEILARAAQLTRRGGRLAYATCSMLRDENEDQISAFLSSHPDWSLLLQRSWPIDDVGDGFFLSILSH